MWVVHSEGHLTVSILHELYWQNRLLWYKASRTPPKSKGEASVRVTGGTTSSQCVGRGQSQESDLQKCPTVSSKARRNGEVRMRHSKLVRGIGTTESGGKSGMQDPQSGGISTLSQTRDHLGHTRRPNKMKHSSREKLLTWQCGEKQGENRTTRTMKIALVLPSWFVLCLLCPSIRLLVTDMLYQPSSA